MKWNYPDLTRESKKETEGMEKNYDRSKAIHWEKKKESFIYVHK